VLLIGQTGVGKTFIAQATGLHAYACGKYVAVGRILQFRYDPLSPLVAYIGATSRESRVRPFNQDNYLYLRECLSVADSFFRRQPIQLSPITPPQLQQR
jgi:hypothetical protein